jgi:hypothetical protein
MSSPQTGNTGRRDSVSNADDYAKFYNRLPDAVIRVYDDAGNVIETHEHTERFQRMVKVLTRNVSHFPLKSISNVPAFIGRSPGKQPD